ncbi:MAG: hypothetical protein QNJ54_04705 [Prochloraceae cyanobacterium]|nr:hypothetical protein [Prochloraceae cyanobacterium]
MNIFTSSKSLRQYLRELKNEIVNNYYSFRIGTPNSPYHVLFKKDPYKILFILGHMRSGSSLLTHLLITNPEIIGFGETHLTYSSEKDLKNLIFKVHSQVGDLKMDRKYVLDKILHNNKFIGGEPFSKQVSSIFLIREPKRTISSILKLKPHWNQEEALGYYCRRLQKLENYARSINSKERSFFITHEQIINNTELVFKSLQNFLGVKQPFSEEYEVSNTTGMRFVGDSSENIKAGRIVRNYQREEISIPPELIEQGRQGFDRCYNTLSEYCDTIKNKKS